MDAENEKGTSDLFGEGYFETLSVRKLFSKVSYFLFSNRNLVEYSNKMKYTKVSNASVLYLTNIYHLLTVLVNRSSFFFVHTASNIV